MDGRDDPLAAGDRQEPPGHPLPQVPSAVHPLQEQAEGPDGSAGERLPWKQQHAASTWLGVSREDARTPLPAGSISGPVGATAACAREWRGRGGGGSPALQVPSAALGGVPGAAMCPSPPRCPLSHHSQFRWRQVGRASCHQGPPNTKQNRLTGGHESHARKTPMALPCGLRRGALGFGGPPGGPWTGWDSGEECAEGSSGPPGAMWHQDHPMPSTPSPWESLGFGSSVEFK